jgi:hypothetical protein
LGVGLFCLIAGAVALRNDLKMDLFSLPLSFSQSDAIEIQLLDTGCWMLGCLKSMLVFIRVTELIPVTSNGCGNQ